VDALGVEHSTQVPATNREEAARRVREEVLAGGGALRDVEYSVAEWWPAPPSPDGESPTHAWFIGFVQESSGGHDFARPRIAFAVMLEYGGSGGRQAGPVAAEVARLIIDDFPQYLVD
jgi:hypothetical protein